MSLTLKPYFAVQLHVISLEKIKYKSIPFMYMWNIDDEDLEKSRDYMCTCESKSTVYEKSPRNDKSYFKSKISKIYYKII